MRRERELRMPGGMPGVTDPVLGWWRRGRNRNRVVATRAVAAVPGLKRMATTGSRRRRRSKHRHQRGVLG